MKSLWHSVLDCYTDLTKVSVFPLEKEPCRSFKEVKTFLNWTQQFRVWCWQHRWQEMASFLSKQLRAIAFVTSTKITLCLWLLFHHLRGWVWLNQGRKYVFFCLFVKILHRSFSAFDCSPLGTPAYLGLDLDGSEQEKSMFCLFSRCGILASCFPCDIFRQKQEGMELSGKVRWAG